MKPRSIFRFYGNMCFSTDTSSAEIPMSRAEKTMMIVVVKGMLTGCDDDGENGNDGNKE